MRPVVGLLLTAIGLLMTAGCALPNASLSRSGESGWPSKYSTGKVDGESQRRLTFKPPRPSSDSVVRSADERTKASMAQPGDSFEDTSQAPNNSVVFAAGHSTDPSSLTSGSARTQVDDPSNLNEPSHFDELGSESGEILQVSHVPVKNGEPNPIQLQGLEVDDGRVQANPSKPLISPWDHATDRGKKTETRPAINGRPMVNESAPRNWAGHSAEVRPQQPGNSRILHPNTAETSKQPTHAGALQQTAMTSGVVAGSSLSWQAQLEQLIVRLEQDLARLPTDQTNASHGAYLRKQAHLRLLYLIAERQEDALDAIPQATSSQQEFWQQMIWAMSNSLDTEQFPDSDERAAQTLAPLSSALRQMREDAPLSIKNMSFCRKISYFGNYDRFPRNEFTPGYEVLLYTEIENFTSTPTVDGEYRTSLKSLMEITDATGKVVWTKGFPPTEDFCRNPRRDYFHNYQFHIPEDLPIGIYSLKLTIVDELSHKRVSSTLGFALK